MKNSAQKNQPQQNRHIRQPDTTEYESPGTCNNKKFHPPPKKKGSSPSHGQLVSQKFDMRCGRYSTETLSAYIDNALPRKILREIDAHLGTCEVCRHTVHAFDSVDNRVAASISFSLSPSDALTQKEQIMAKIEHEKESARQKAQKKKPWRRDALPFTMKFSNLMEMLQFKPWKIYLQLASLAAIILISGTLLKTMAPLPWDAKPAVVQYRQEPSAIVTSVDGDVASMMILETEQTQHTIIWYQEV